MNETIIEINKGLLVPSIINALLTVPLGVLYALNEVRLGYKKLRIEAKNILYLEE